MGKIAIDIPTDLIERLVRIAHHESEHNAQAAFVALQSASLYIFTAVKEGDTLADYLEQCMSVWNSFQKREIIVTNERTVTHGKGKKDFS